MSVLSQVTHICRMQYYLPYLKYERHSININQLTLKYHTWKSEINDHRQLQTEDNVEISH